MRLVDSQFRTDIMNASGLPFAPSSYTVKRNYKRVFECMMLATYIKQRLIVSDIGKAIAEQDPRMSRVDGYLFEIERRFRYPYPAFDNYNDVKSICFPFLAILKLLFYRGMENNGSSAKLSLTDVGAYLIANDVSGLEDLDFYKNLKPKDHFTFDSYGSNDQKRQVREMMHFIGQHSYIDVTEGGLTLTGLTSEDCFSAFASLQPYNTLIESRTPIDDFLKLTGYTHIAGEFEGQSDIEEYCVQEGKRVFKSHFQYERNSQLRKEYIRRNPIPLCDVCGRNMHLVYPWTENMLEIHHIHPLSNHSSASGEHLTNINDVVGICPSCHRAIHLYYKLYLSTNNLSDFESSEKAKEIYNEAKTIVKNNV